LHLCGMLAEQLSPAGREALSALDFEVGRVWPRSAGTRNKKGKVRNCYTSIQSPVWAGCLTCGVKIAGSIVGGFLRVDHVCHDNAMNRCLLCKGFLRKRSKYQHDICGDCGAETSHNGQTSTSSEARASRVAHVRQKDIEDIIQFELEQDEEDELTAMTQGTPCQRCDVCEQYFPLDAHMRYQESFRGGCPIRVFGCASCTASKERGILASYKAVQFMYLELRTVFVREYVANFAGNFRRPIFDRDNINSRVYLDFEWSDYERINDILL